MINPLRYNIEKSINNQTYTKCMYNIITNLHKFSPAENRNPNPLSLNHSKPRNDIFHLNTLRIGPPN